MRKVLILIVALSFLALPAVAHAKRQNYRPWKHALERAYETYSDQYWESRAHNGEALNWTTTFNSDKNVWDFETQTLCCYVKALYGVFPTDGLDWARAKVFTVGDVYDIPLDAATKEFLRPFKGSKTFGGSPWLDLSLCPLPWIVGLR